MWSRGAGQPVQMCGADAAGSRGTCPDFTLMQPPISDASHWLSQRGQNPGEADPELGVLGHRAKQTRVGNEQHRVGGNGEQPARQFPAFSQQLRSENKP